MAKFTEEQMAFIKHNTPESVILSATAGSGKTASATGRLVWLLNKGIRPEKIIFFSFTNDAVDELRQRINNDKVYITTIHSFCASVLAKSKRFKRIADFNHYVNWYKKKYKPKKKAGYEVLYNYNRAVEKLEEDPGKYATEITKFKLLQADNTKSKLPTFYKSYCVFLKETGSRDFADMLLDVHKMSSTSKIWEKQWQYKWSHVFVDEYQDTSPIQMEILLSLKAQIYHLIGDRNQSIYGFQGSDVDRIEKILKKAKTVKEYSLSMNFRSAKTIVNNANNYSNLKAKPFHSEIKGLVHKDLLTERGLLEMLKEKDIVILARTNAVIRELEMKFLLKKIPLRYFNVINDEELDIIKTGKNVPRKLNQKLKRILPAFGPARDLVQFIEENRDKKSFVTSIHKSKGREYPTCVIVNSFSPEIMEHNNIQVDEKELKRLSFDPEDYEDREAQNIHYVAVTRPKQELYYMWVDEESLEIL